MEQTILIFETSTRGNGNLFCEGSCTAPPDKPDGSQTPWSQKRWPRYLGHAARLIMGGVFVYASWDKILHPAAFAEAVFNYQILPSQLINLVALILPWLELIAGVLLLSGIWIPGAVLGINILMITFLAAIIFNTARGLNISCGCFSTETTDSGLSIWTVLRDVFFFCLSLFLLFVTVQGNGDRKADG